MKGVRMFKIILIATVLVITYGKPVPDDNSPVPQLISFDNGRVGVNFLGYHASAGLGGLLTGNSADGGLHAEAGTPHGQAAAAGLGGGVDGQGRSSGSLYAGATAGGGVSASAGLAGATDAAGALGTGYAGASSGISESHVEKIVTRTKPGSLSGSFKASLSAPVNYHKEVEEIPKPESTLIQRTVIPNYVEKTIHVPSYVEKTIRVPTLTVKHVRVPTTPTVNEKSVSPLGSSVEERGISIDDGVVNGVAKTKIRYYRPHHFFHHKHIGFFAGGNGGYGGGMGGGSAINAEGESNLASSGSYTVTKTASPQLFQDIFNIPIATLGAVNKLVGGIAGGTSGSVSVQKTYGI